MKAGFEFLDYRHYLILPTVVLVPFDTTDGTILLILHALAPAPTDKTFRLSIPASKDGAAGPQRLPNARGIVDLN